MDRITVFVNIDLPKEKVWEYFTNPNHVVNWNFATDEWHCPKATADLKPGGKFSYRMEAKDGSIGFDFEGEYIEIIPEAKIVYQLGDERKVEITFTEDKNGTRITEEFDADDNNSAEMQRKGWQSILNNFKKYAENSAA